jgi:uncharacterized paraquat-inducible protein A
MILALMIVGVGTIVLSLIAGLISGTWLGFFTIAIGGSTSSLLFFSLARILENQEQILNQLCNREASLRASRTQEQKICSYCNHHYDADYTSCPKCGHKE